MEDDKNNPSFEDGQPDSAKMNNFNTIEDDSDSLAPLDDLNEQQEIDTNNPAEIKLWANKFKISEEDMKAVIVLNGNLVKDIKEYLSI